MFLGGLEFFFQNIQKNSKKKSSTAVFSIKWQHKSRFFWKKINIFNKKKSSNSKFLKVLKTHRMTIKFIDNIPYGQNLISVDGIFENMFFSYFFEIFVFFQIFFLDHPKTPFFWLKQKMEFKQYLMYICLSVFQTMWGCFLCSLAMFQKNVFFLEHLLRLIFENKTVPFLMS